MPRDGSGVYSLPAGTAADFGATAVSADNNARFDDVKDDLNAARPISAGGTGATSKSAARTSLELLKAPADATTFVSGEAVMVGSGGFLDDAPSPDGAITDLDDITSGYAWNIGSAGAYANTPAGASSGLLVVRRRSGSRVIQQYYEIAPSGDRAPSWVRTFNSTGWSPWARVLTTEAPKFAAYQTATYVTPISTASWTLLEFDTEDFDIGTNFAPSASSGIAGIFTAPYTGHYEFSATIHGAQLYSAPLANTVMLGFSINNAAPLGQHQNEFVFVANSAMRISRMMSLTAGQTVRVKALIDTNAMNVLGNKARVFSGVAI